MLAWETLEGSGLHSPWQGRFPVTRSVRAGLASNSLPSVALTGRADGLLAFNDGTHNTRLGAGGRCQGSCASGCQCWICFTSQIFKLFCSYPVPPDGNSITWDERCSGHFMTGYWALCPDVPGIPEHVASALTSRTSCYLSWRL